MSPVLHPIVPIPEVPQAIIDAVERKTGEGKLAIFVGAGVSRLVGCFGWDDLAISLVRRCKEEGLINYRGQDLLARERDRKKIITVCYELLTGDGKEEIFFAEMEKSMAGDSRKRTADIYKKLARLNALILTTNADRHAIQPYIEARRFYDVKQMTRASVIDKECVYQIHGSIDHRETLVFTVPKYIEQYRQGEFAEFLKEIFSRFVVLFVGYGLAEFEVMDYVIMHSDSSPSLPRFTLQPYYRGDDDLLRFDAYYFKNLKMEVIPYEMDANGYDQLYDLLDEWGNKVARRTEFLSKKTSEIDEII